MYMRKAETLKIVVVLALMSLISGCAAYLPERPTEARHITGSDTPPATAIPDVVHTPSLIVPPEPEGKAELYTVVVQDVPARELLFQIARDASLNIDVHPGITGNVTLNAIDQTLPQILTRIARQIDIRWNLDRPNLIVEPDKPVLRSYRIDYVNIARKSKGEVSVATSLSSTTGAKEGEGSGGSGSNNSTTELLQESNNMFWATLVANLRAILGEAGGTSAGGDAEGGGGTSIISNPESGLITVRATTRQHEDIQKFIDMLMKRALQQVLIEATVVEVKLNDHYQAGVDWASLERDNGRVSFVQSVLGINLPQVDPLNPFATAPVTTMTIDKSADPDALTATIKMLSTFGDIKVLSSPKVMVLNNQTAMLKVVDNKVYFTIDVDIENATDTSPRMITYTSNVHTVPIGFLMAVTPQVSESDQITLNVRPTISRIIGYVQDPNPALANANVVSEIPEVQVREVESILKVASGQIGVLGGLMQDTMDKNKEGLPGFSRLPWVGSLFSYRDDTVSKTELIIFLRPVVIKEADVNGGDLRQYKELLPTERFIPTMPVDGLPSR